MLYFKGKQMIVRCKCKHEYQDKKYGKGNRVHNECSSRIKGQKIVRCTVCGNTKQV